MYGWHPLEIFAKRQFHGYLAVGNCDRALISLIAAMWGSNKWTFSSVNEMNDFFFIEKAGKGVSSLKIRIENLIKCKPRRAGTVPTSYSQRFPSTYFKSHDMCAPKIVAKHILGRN